MRVTKPSNRVQPYYKKPDSSTPTPSKSRGIKEALIEGNTAYATLHNLDGATVMNIVLERPRTFKSMLLVQAFLKKEHYGASSSKKNRSSSGGAHMYQPIRVALDTPHPIKYAPNRFNGSDNEALTMQIPLGDFIEDKQFKELLHHVDCVIAEVMLQDEDILRELIKIADWKPDMEELLANRISNIRVDREGDQFFRAKWLQKQDYFLGYLWDKRKDAPTDVDGNPMLMHPEDIVGGGIHAVQGTIQLEKVYIRPLDRVWGSSWSFVQLKCTSCEHEEEVAEETKEKEKPVYSFD